jgi:hypothetical protein
VLIVALGLDRPDARLWPMVITVVYCLTRDRELAAALDDRLVGAIVFFYNDAARLHQAVTLRPPDLVVVDTGAVREEYGDAGLGPVVAFLASRSPGARVAVRPRAGVEHLVAAEAGPGVELLPAEGGPCVEAVAALCGCS